MEDTGLSTKQEGLKTEALVTRTNEGASTWHPNTTWRHSSIVAIIIINNKRYEGLIELWRGAVDISTHQKLSNYPDGSD